MGEYVRDAVSVRDGEAPGDSEHVADGVGRGAPTVAVVDGETPAVNEDVDVAVAFDDGETGENEGVGVTDKPEVGDTDADADVDAVIETDLEPD